MNTKSNSYSYTYSNFISKYVPAWACESVTLTANLTVKLKE